MKIFSRHSRTVRPDIVPLSDTELGAALPSASASHEIDNRIAALAGAGALDEGNKRVLDGLIESWREQHQELLTAFHLDLAGSREKRIRELSGQVDLAKERLARCRVRLENLGSSPAVDQKEPVQLGGTQAVDEQATEVAA